MGICWIVYFLRPNKKSFRFSSAFRSSGRVAYCLAVLHLKLELPPPAVLVPPALCLLLSLDINDVHHLPEHH